MLDVSFTALPKGQTSFVRSSRRLVRPEEVRLTGEAEAVLDANEAGLSQFGKDGLPGQVVKTTSGRLALSQLA